MLCLRRLRPSDPCRSGQGLAQRLCQRSLQGLGHCLVERAVFVVGKDFERSRPLRAVAGVNRHIGVEFGIRVLCRHPCRDDAALQTGQRFGLPFLFLRTRGLAEGGAGVNHIRDHNLDDALARSFPGLSGKKA